MDALETINKWSAVRACYLLSLGFIGGLIICLNDKLDYLDSLFLAVSALTGTGLSPVPMARLSGVTFYVLGVCMFFGGTVVLLIPTIVARRIHYLKLRKTVYKDPGENADIVRAYDELYDAAQVAWILIAAYIVFIHFICIVLTWGGLALLPLEPEMEERHFSRLKQSVFFTFSSFANAGFAMSSSSASYLAKAPLAYLPMCLAMLAGNTCFPIFMRIILNGIVSLCKVMNWNAKKVQYILDNPRHITTNIFPAEPTRFYAMIVFGLNVSQYVFFLGSCMEKEREPLILEVFGDRATVAGIGFFQTISTRFAGLQMVDLRLLNRGMLVVYLLCMYTSSAPFIGALYSSDDDALPVRVTTDSERISERLSEKRKGAVVADSGELVEAGGEVSDGQELISEETKKNDVSTQKAAQDDENAPLAVLQNAYFELVDTADEKILEIEMEIKEAIESPAIKFSNNYLQTHSLVIILCVLLTAFFEDRLIRHNPDTANLFIIIFEIVSAYGNVGLSVSLPGIKNSLAGNFRDPSKIILIAVMMLGKHRGLPKKNDPAIDFRFPLLPAVNDGKGPQGLEKLWLQMQDLWRNHREERTRNRLERRLKKNQVAVNRPNKTDMKA